MREKRVATITVGVDYDTSVESIKLAEENVDIWSTIGMHPADNTTEEFIMEKYLELAKNPKVVAIGECGLDYFRLPKDEEEIKSIKERQKNIFLKHIEIAQKSNKPLMIHARPSKGTMDAYEDVLEMLRNTANAPRANFHFFVGNVEIAKQILEMGGTMSFDGPITFSKDYDEVITFIPLENIMAETDAPFAAPAPHRGKTCEPWMVEEVVKRIGEIKNESLEKTQKQLIENAKNFFKLNS
jgi:TatD DNase family protein